MPWAGLGLRALEKDRPMMVKSIAVLTDDELCLLAGSCTWTETQGRM
jgi:hypothetical protein